MQTLEGRHSDVGIEHVEIKFPFRWRSLPVKVRLRLARVPIAFAVGALVVVTEALSGQYEEGLAARDRGDFSAALSTFKQLASAGDSNSQFQLSLLYKSGKGVSADAALSMYWLRQAATHGSVSAQSNLGVAFNMGRFVAQDLPKAYVWLSIAAAGGDRVASTNLEVVARKLTPVQLKQATDLAQTCSSGNFTPCL